ncbi:hypothetical protein JCM17844_00220 [Iodidimonas gelatinilytica]|uniref:Glycosyl hydrolase family 13 catalytic domain-containing protein n=1 Tax=Iodidimonas gelatinilytica TaxID=1236966 RepID=A0A5A7MMZ5_9PROT|nr:alpha-amylase family glycosyl hydrolase [Iodidimonas gelatinilytica]GEQ96385.1 hypothetical protein JCM17844_00220 [Iodidimonas gelatinilytica]
MTEQPQSKTDACKAETAWWRGAVIYQIYPRSFKDASGDGIGDLKGILEHLDHIADLGVDGIWISPFFTSPMRDYGYDIADYCNVDPIFGTLEDFDAVLEKAHQLGLKLIIDQVYSHSSDQHSWFMESRSSRTNPKADWYVWADPKADGSPPNNWQSLFKGPAWTWDGHRKQYYLHNFLSEQPDLNLHNADVQAAILESARFWLDRGVDGFRLMRQISICTTPDCAIIRPAASKARAPMISKPISITARNRKISHSSPGCAPCLTVMMIGLPLRKLATTALWMN